MGTYYRWKLLIVKRNRRKEVEMRSKKSVLLLFFSLLMVALFSAPLLAAEGMKVRMGVDGMI